MTTASLDRDDTLTAPLPPSRRYQRQRERILDAATVLLNRSGVHGMTFQEVAQSLGLTTTSVTYYFRLKDQLVAAVFADTLTRIDAMVTEASREATPEARVACYLRLHFEHRALSLRGQTRPLAILSEARTLDDALRQPLADAYQHILAGVRGFFGPTANEREGLVFAARAHLLNEAIFWCALWLDQYAISDFDRVRRRTFDILRHGIAGPGQIWDPAVITSVEAQDDAGDRTAQTGRTAFLRAATRLINDAGYRGASIDRIAAELKLTKGSFYHHVDAKDHLVLQCFRESYRRVLNIFHAGGADDRTGWSRLSASIALSLRVQFAGDCPLLGAAALQAMPDPVRRHAVVLANRHALRLTGLLVDGIADGSIRAVDPLIASQIIMSTIHAANDLRRWAERQPLDDAIGIYAATLHNGLFAPVP